MKKFVLSILIFACAVALVACVSQPNEQETYPNDTMIETEPATVDTQPMTSQEETVTETQTTQEPNEETTAETTVETQKEYESGEWPEACSIDFDALKSISVAVDEVQEVATVGFVMNADRYQAKYQQGQEYYQIDVVVDDPDILEVVDINKDKLMDYDAGGGLTLKGLAQGETKITLIMTYLPTGGTYSSSTTVTVTVTVTTPTE